MGFTSGYINSNILNFLLTSILAFHQISIFKYSFPFQTSKLIIFYTFGNTFNSISLAPLIYGSVLGMTVAISITTDDQLELVKYLGGVNIHAKEVIEQKKTIFNNYIQKANKNRVYYFFKSITSNVYSYIYKYLHNIFKTGKSLIHLNINMQKEANSNSNDENEKSELGDYEIDLKDLDLETDKSLNVNANIWKYLNLSDSINSNASFSSTKSDDSLCNELNLNYVI